MYLDSPVNSQTVASLQEEGTGKFCVSTLIEVTNLGLSMVSTSKIDLVYSARITML